MKQPLYYEWIKASYDDLKVISKIIDSPDLTHMIAFHAQQSIEKSFKALMEYKNIRVPKQHDLIKLKEAVSNDIFADDDLLDTLNQLYIDSRYPGDMGLLPYGKPTLEDAKEFYKFANDIFEQAIRIIGIEKNELL
ncbi:hypothetical protein NitYY0826_C0930 [Nitratiruptor sp. YY08-26]|uniref:HEPN domain-containing protein n=1 Tax=unclassified Nitratiruptor TaxID=2624044 RepID=UPI0019168310|nr:MULTISPECIES: HEPN domain-containing protein [unclassified Nitratiruptor]BCD62061.1 hypothetical protein NitYY0813_C0928 [Nitratiruptor sp. YY08-13]BCD65997.1 hypothetical protein NitYY0826_C0930 [Nitratiruptor sp. YY08-26]